MNRLRELAEKAYADQLESTAKAEALGNKRLALDTLERAVDLFRIPFHVDEANGWAISGDVTLHLDYSFTSPRGVLRLVRKCPDCGEQFTSDFKEVSSLETLGELLSETPFHIRCESNPEEGTADYRFLDELRELVRYEIRMN